MNWLRARLAEPSTYGGIGGMALVACFATFTWLPEWRFFGWFAGVAFVAQAIMQEQRGRE